MKTLCVINFVIAVIFSVCYSYQFVFVPIVWIKKGIPKQNIEVKENRFAVLICARNEAEVIADLLSSIKNQTYPSKHITTFVMADNCTDRTADIARENGAVIYERYNNEIIGKGYALEVLLNNIKDDYGDIFDGYFVFDADNILSANYIEEMNKTFSGGHDIVTSYRNSKNYGSNWISAGYALWFLRESRYLNQARFLSGTSCAVSGTGFLFSRDVLNDINGWPFHMLTEDIEFSINRIINGYKIAFCDTAELYDEQPVLFKESWNQRMRWSKGYLQVFKGYGKDLIKGIFKGNFSCFDMSMTIMPAYILSALSIISNIGFGIWGAVIGDDIMIAAWSIAQTLWNMYLVLFIISLITTITEWKHINTEWYKKIFYMITFPFFMFTYIPISFIAIFANTTWKPIKHSYSIKKMAKEGYVNIADITDSKEKI